MNLCDFELCHLDENEIEMMESMRWKSAPEFGKIHAITVKTERTVEMKPYKIEMGTNDVKVKEFLSNGETAFSNQQFDVALGWFEKACQAEPDNVYALSRTGAACIPLQNFDRAIAYFTSAVTLDPETGDNYFNLANAYFFKEDYVRALEHYASAELKGCSEYARPKLYYQMAVLCRAKEDIKSALINYKKYEEADKAGGTAGNPDVILEKIRLHLLDEDYENAENCAMQLILLSPGAFNGYAIYFQILLAAKKYDKAETVLDDAVKYAELDAEHELAVGFHKVTLCALRAESEPDRAAAHYQDALARLDGLKAKPGISKARENEITLTTAEIYLKTEQFDKAIHCIHEMLQPKVISAPTGVSEDTDAPVLDDSQLEDMIAKAIEDVDRKVETGEIDSDLWMQAEIYYDEHGNEVREYPAHAFPVSEPASALEEAIPVPLTEALEDDSGYATSEADFYDKVNFILLSCYASKEDYKNALAYAGTLKHSDNIYYRYFGTYTEAFATKKLSDQGKMEKEAAMGKYHEMIAFFRARMFEQPGDKFAVIFRARAYAEIGKFEKATEMAVLLSAEEKESVLAYIDQYREEYGRNFRT